MPCNAQQKARISIINSAMILPVTYRLHLVFIIGLLTVGIGLTGSADGALFGRLETAPGSGVYQAYYDDQLDITWLADANFAKTTGFSDDDSADGSMLWAVAKIWAAGLVVEGISGWRLPMIAPVDRLALRFNYAVNGTTDNGFNISAKGTLYAGSTSNELAHLFFNTLGNKAFRNLIGEPAKPGWGLSNSGPFKNVYSGYYWSAAESLPDPNSAGAYGFSGEQSWGSKDFYFRAWPVHDGDVAGL